MIKIQESKEKYVIYKVLGKYKGTPESNYNAYIQNARAVQDLSNFESAKDIMDAFIRWGWADSYDEFIVKK